MIRTYSELCTLGSFQDRYDYLKLRGVVGEETFGSERFANQKFYGSYEWRQMRNFVIARDLGCDLGMPDRPLQAKLLIHHLNPITLAQIVDGDPVVLDPENLIVTQLRTHNAIHYGDESQLPRDFVPRSPGDTKLW